jgi:hypothetical protein
LWVTDQIEEQHELALWAETGVEKAVLGIAAAAGYCSGTGTQGDQAPTRRFSIVQGRSINTDPAGWMLFFEQTPDLAEILSSTSSGLSAIPLSDAIE